MRASELPFERYISERILCFAYLMWSSLSEAKALKIVSAICHIQFQWKVTEHCRNRIKNMECSCKNRSHWRNISKENIHRQVFAVYALIYPPSKFVGNRTNSLWVLVFYHFKWENWFEKTALNMSIRRVIFTSGQNLKPPFLCQYWIFFNDFFSLHGRFHLDHYFNQKIEIWRKLSIWRYTVTLSRVTTNRCYNHVSIVF